MSTKGAVTAARAWRPSGRLQVALFLAALLLAEGTSVLLALGPAIGEPLQPVDLPVFVALLVAFAVGDAGAVWLTFYVQVERRA